LLASGGIDWLATGGSDGAVLLWDIAERCEVATFPGGSTCVAFHPSGRWLASASLVNSVCVWDVETGQLDAEWLGHEDAITCLAYSPDGRWLASGGDDRTVRLWETATGKLVAVTDLHTPIKVLAFSPDSRSLFTSNGNLTCYQLDVQRLLAGKGKRG
jgi:WD40 repeat protein